MLINIQQEHMHKESQEIYQPKQYAKILKNTVFGQCCDKKQQL